METLQVFAPLAKLLGMYQIKVPDVYSYKIAIIVVHGIS
jgi:hypothetical protein